MQEARQITSHYLFSTEVRLELETKTLALLDTGEGTRRYAYDASTGRRVHAPKGNLTIGRGLNLDVGLSDHEIEWLERNRLHHDISLFEVEVSSVEFQYAEPIRFSLLPDNVQIALALMVYQLGVTGTLGFHAILSCIARKQWHQAAIEAKNSKWFRETPKRVKIVIHLLTSINNTDKEIPRNIPTNEK